MFFKFLDVEFLRLELLHSTSIPSVEDSEMQHGSGVNTRRMKRVLENEDEKTEVKIPKTEIDDKKDTSDEYCGGQNPLFEDNFKNLQSATK